MNTPLVIINFVFFAISKIYMYILVSFEMLLDSNNS